MPKFIIVVWEFIKEYWYAFVIGLGIILLILLILALIPAPFSGGVIISKSTDPERQWDAEETDTIYRRVPQTYVRTYSDSKGKTHTTIGTRMVSVYDHTDIVTYHFIDDEDWLLTVSSVDNVAGYNWFQRTFNSYRENKSFILYVDKSTWDLFRIEQEFHVREHPYWQYDKIQKYEIARRRS